MDLLIGAWIAIGVVIGSFLALTDREFQGVFMLLVVVLIWPFVLLYVGYSTLSQTDIKEPSQPQKRHNTEKNSSNQQVNSVSTEDEIRQLIADLTNVFIERSKPLRKADYVRACRLGTIVRGLKVDSIPGKDVCAEIFQSALENLPTVYREGEGSKESRLKAIRRALAHIDADRSLAVYVPQGVTPVKIESFRFELPFDIDQVAQALLGWELVSSYPGDTHELLSGPENSWLKASMKQVEIYTDFNDYVDTVKSSDVPGEVTILEGHSPNGQQFFGVEGFDDGVANGALLIESVGFKVAYFTYESHNGRLLNKLIQVLHTVTWSRALRTASDIYQASSSKQVNQLLRRLMPVGSELADEIIEGISDEFFHLSSRDMKEAALSSVDVWPALESAVDFGLRKNEIDSTVDLIALAKLFEPCGIDNKDLAVRLESAAKSNANSTRDFIELLDIAGLQDAVYRQYWHSALDSAEDFHDLSNLVENRHTDSSGWGLVDHRLETAIRGEPEFRYIGNPISVLAEAFDRGFLTEDELCLRCEQWLSAGLLTATEDHQALMFLSNGNSSINVDAVLNGIIDSAEKHATSDQIVEWYEYFNDDLEDSELAEAWKTRHTSVIQKYEASRHETDQEASVLEAICQCAALASFGDGEISSSEIDEVPQIKGLVRMIRSNQHAISVLEKTGDITLARESRGCDVIIHDASDLVLFGVAPWLSKVSDDLKNVIAGNGDVGALIAAYAANIEQSFDQKLALWAMYEVAAADGIDDGEMVVIHAFAEKWGIDFDENQRWMQRIVFPLISDDIDYRGEDSSARGDLLDSARELDKELASGGDGGDFFTTLLTEFGVDSIEDLVNELTDGEDDDHTVPAQSIDEWPAIWKAYSEDEWDGVLNAIKSGVDVNETADIGGVGGLPIITICAEQGPSDVVLALLKAGADPNLETQNLELASGYEHPLCAAIKAYREDVVDMPLQHGAEVDPFEDMESGWTPLTIAAQNELPEFVGLLLSRGADPNIARADGSTALKLCGSHDSTPARKCIRLLAKAGADPERLDKEGFGAIHNAVCDGSVETVRVLVEVGKTPVNLEMGGLRASRQSHPLNRALSWGNTDVAKYLLAKGASLAEGYGTMNAFKAIFDGATRHDLSSPMEWLDSALSQDRQPTFADVMSLFSSLEYAEDPNIRSWAPQYFEKLLAAVLAMNTDITSPIEACGFRNESTWGGAIEEALEIEPATAKAFLKILEQYGIDPLGILAATSSKVS